MKIEWLPIQGLALVHPRIFHDERGWFCESYQSKRYQEAGLSVEFVQDNMSFSKLHTLRGLHYQESPGQAKLVSVTKGTIWDVAVDIRKDSPTFGQWHAVELTEENFLQFFIPIGFAHGFLVLSDVAQVHYKVSAPYDHLMERTIRWNDPKLAIQWPIQNPILSKRDASA